MQTLPYDSVAIQMATLRGQRGKVSASAVELVDDSRAYHDDESRV